MNEHFFWKKMLKHLWVWKNTSTFAPHFGNKTSGERLPIGRKGCLAQLVQSICLTSRGSAVRIRQHPPKVWKIDLDGSLAQLNRAFDYGSKGCRFESCRSHLARRKVSGLGRYQSGQMGQTVNLLAYAFGGSNPSLPPMRFWKNAERLWQPSVEADTDYTEAPPNVQQFSEKIAEIAQLVEHNLAKVGVASSSLVFRSRSLKIMVR